MNTTSVPNALTRFLWFCAGVNPEALLQCPPSEYAKFTGIGGTVFFTGLLATLSGGYAFYTVFASSWAAVAFGLLWGLIIFNLDRFIISTIKKEGGFRRQFTLAIPRLLLALLLAVVIAKPLELRIFQGEINEILAQERVEKGAAAGAKFEQESTTLDTRILELETQTEERLQARERDYQDYKCECDGTCGTGKTGRGSECERKEQKYLLANREYQETKAANEVEILRLRAEIESLAATASTARKEADATFATGLLARLRAADKLPWAPGVFLMLLLAMIEVSPILAKLLAPRGPYDELLARIEGAFSLEQRNELGLLQRKLEKENTLGTELDKAELSARLSEKEQTLRSLSDARQELVQDQIDEWLAEERARLGEEGNRAPGESLNNPL